MEQRNDLEGVAAMSQIPPDHFTFVPPTPVIRPRSLLPVVTPGEPIPVEPGFLRGHGTMQRADGALVATVAGVVERVNKLVSVKPLRSRYTGEVGDVVVARIVDVGTKRWRADVNARQHAILMLSSINLPGGEQRRRTAEDQLNMRQFYVEHELMSAEVQAFFHDGAMSLHTRSLKYGKLEGGVLVVVAPSLMKRLRQHFHTFEFGVHAIFGMNGYVWVAPGAAPGAGAGAAEEMWVGPGGAVGADEGAGGGNDAAAPAPRPPPTAEERERVCRVRNALVALDQLSIAISPATVAEAYRASVDAAMAPKAMLLPENAAAICKPAAALAARGAAAELGPSAMDVDAGAAPPPADERTMALNAEAAKRFITAALDT